MYSAPYGFPNAAGPTFNGGAPPPQNLHLQPGPSPSQQSQPMMYNPQQFAMAASQGHYPGGPNMMPTAGPAGMMQNAALPPHMAAANGQMAYQTPYTSASYGATIPSPAVSQPQLPVNFNAMPGAMSAYGMNTPGMPQQQPQQQPQPSQQQQMMQRMHPSHQNPAIMGAQTPHRSFNPAHVAPNSMPPHQQHFSPQQASQNVMQNPNPPSSSAQQHQQPNAVVTTPQTPTFPHAAHGSNAHDSSAVQTPLSPGSESREKERFAVLLDINAELMYEAVQLQNTILEHKKDNDTFDEGGKIQKRPLTEEEEPLHHDYAQVMRRLQTNLAYLATLVERKPGPSVPCPAYLMAPTANLSIKLRNPTPRAESEVKPDPQAERQERAKTLKELYGRLQALYPGIDYTKEPVYPAEKKSQGGQGQYQTQQRPERAQGGSSQASPVATPGPNRTPQMATLPPPGQAAALQAA